MTSVCVGVLGGGVWSKQYGSVGGAVYDSVKAVLWPLSHWYLSSGSYPFTSLDLVDMCKDSLALAVYVFG